MLTFQNAAKSAKRCIQKQKGGKNGTTAKTAIVIHILMTLMQANMKRRMEITALGTAIQNVSSTCNNHFFGKDLLIVIGELTCPPLTTVSQNR